MIYLFLFFLFLLNLNMLLLFRYSNVVLGKNARTVFEKFAQRSDFDPLIAGNWYSVQAQSLAQFQVLSAAEQLSLSIFNYKFI